VAAVYCSATVGVQDHLFGELAAHRHGHCQRRGDQMRAQVIIRGDMVTGLVSFPQVEAVVVVLIPIQATTFRDA
jgi:hypothetical protein